MSRLLKAVPPPIFNWMGAMPFPAIQSLFDPFFPKGLQWYWKGDFVKALTDEAIDTHIAQAAQAPSELCLMHLYPIDGAVHRVSKDATAWSARDATFSMVIAAVDNSPEKAKALRDWGRAYWKAVHPFNMEGAYVNFMMDDESAGQGTGELWRELRASVGHQGEIRSEEPLPSEPEHRAGFRVKPAVGPANLAPHETEHAKPPSRARLVALTAAALVAFASNSILCRLALSRAEIDPASFTTIRLVSGAAALWMLAAVLNPRSGPAGNWASAAALAAYAVAFSYAYVSLEAGVGALLLFGAVQTTMILAAVRGGERTSSQEWAGLVAALAGLVYLVSPGLAAPPPFGAALMVTAGVAWGLYTLRGRRSVAPVLVTAGNFARSAPMVLAVSGAALLSGGTVRATPVGIGLALASGVLSSGFGYVVWYAALRHLTAVRAATVQLVVPVLGAVGGILLLGESLSPRLALAAVLILGGIAIAVVRPYK